MPAPSLSVATEIPFRLAGGDQPLILIPVSVNAVAPADFILDTGAGLSLLTPELAEQAGITPTESKEGLGAGGKVTVSLAKARSLSIGEALLEDVPVAITDDLHRIGAAVGTVVSGNIGHDVLKHFRLTIDYHRRLLRLAHRDGNHSETLTNGLGFTLAHPGKPLIMVPTMVNDVGPFPFAVDTGASRTVISPGLATRLGIDSVMTTPLTGAGGRVPSAAGRIESLRIGDAKVAHLVVMVADFLDMLSQAIGVRVEGIIGYNYLREFIVTIDYPRETLRLVLRG